MTPRRIAQSGDGGLSAQAESASDAGAQWSALTEQAERNVKAKVLPEGRFYQFRLAFGSTQAKGCFKVMSDDVADALAVDFILPKSCVKPEYKGPSVLRQVLSGLQGVDTRVFEGPVVFGIRDMSRALDPVTR